MVKQRMSGLRGGDITFSNTEPKIFEAILTDGNKLQVFHHAALNSSTIAPKGEDPPTILDVDLFDGNGNKVMQANVNSSSGSSLTVLHDTIAEIGEPELVVKNIESTLKFLFFSSGGISEQFTLQTPLNPDPGQKGNPGEYSYTPEDRGGFWHGRYLFPTNLFLTTPNGVTVVLGIESHLQSCSFPAQYRMSSYYRSPGP